jgi:hypothetical protein
MQTTRLSFLRGSLGVCASGVLLAACGSSSSDKTPSGSACQTTISANHGHSLSIPIADKMAGAAKDYDIKGSADHSHTVSLTAADWADIDAGSLTVTSSVTNGHSHDVSISC